MTRDQKALPHVRHWPGWPLLLLLGAGIILAGSIWFAVAGPFTGSDRDQNSRYVEAVVGAPARVNPIFVYLNDVDRDLATLVFSGLTRLGPDGQVLPDLAESWDVSEDGRQFTFHLRSGVYWHSGVAFSSADVLFTYTLLADPSVQSDPEQAALWRQLSCAAPDDLTITCQLPEPFAPFLSYATIGILPQHILTGPAPAALFDDPFNTRPLGTGPYQLAALDKTDAVLKANNRYYLGAPQIAEIQVRFYPDSSSAAADLVRHEVDGLLMDLTATQEDFQTVASAVGLSAHTAIRSASTVLYLNNSASPLNDLAVRRSIAHAIDFSTIVGDVLGGRASRAESPLIPGTWAFDPEVKPLSYDPGKARKILEEAGWVIPDGANVRQRNNFQLSVSLLTDQDPLRGAVAEAVSEQLAKIGIAAPVVRQPSTSLVRDFLIPREYQAAIFGWDPGPDPDPYPAWHSSQASGNGRNLAAYTSEEADKLMEDGRQTTDMEKRRQLYFRFQEIFEEDVPSVLLYYPVYTYFVSDKVENIQLGALFYPSSRFSGVNLWTLSQAPDIRE